MNTTKQPSQCGLTECQNKPMCDRCKKWGREEATTNTTTQTERDLEHVDLARSIMTWFGRSTSPSREPGADEHVDRLAEKLSEWLPNLRQSTGAQLTAPAPGVIPAGWKLVPVEPTEAMLSAGKQEAHTNKGAMTKCVRIFNAMLTAAPSAPAVREGLTALLSDCRAALVSADRDSDYELVARIDAIAQAQAQQGGAL